MPKSARASALRFLKIRPRSVAELREKLERKDFSLPEIESTLQDLVASGFLDDRAFTKSWISYRLARPFGFRRIIQELKLKGIDPQIIAEAVNEAQGETSSAQTALDLARRRFDRLPAGLDWQKKKKRVLDFLLRRGFEADIALKAIKQLK